MAIYRLRSNIISRGKGQSALAAAAYRAGTRLKDEQDGTMTKDYSHKEEVCYSNITLPENAPEELKDRQTLYNQIEKNEKQQNAQLLRELLITLPNEWTVEESIEHLNEFMKPYVDDGYIVDINIHDKPENIEKGKPRNLHAHILMPLRQLDDKGQWKSKNIKEYACIKKGTEINLKRKNSDFEYKTADELKHVKDEYEKIYSYINPETKKAVKLTPSEAESLGWTERKNRYPISRKVDKSGITYFQRRKILKVERKNWEVLANKYLTPEQQIDCRTKAEQLKDNDIMIGNLIEDIVHDQADLVKEKDIAPELKDDMKLYHVKSISELQHIYDLELQKLFNHRTSLLEKIKIAIRLIKVFVFNITTGEEIEVKEDTSKSLQMSYKRKIESYDYKGFDSELDEDLVSDKRILWRIENSDETEIDNLMTEDEKELFVSMFSSIFNRIEFKKKFGDGIDEREKQTIRDLFIETTYDLEKDGVYFTKDEFNNIFKDEKYLKLVNKIVFNEEPKKRLARYADWDREL